MCRGANILPQCHTALWVSCFAHSCLRAIVPAYVMTLSIFMPNRANFIALGGVSSLCFFFSIFLYSNLAKVLRFGHLFMSTNMY